MKKRILKECLRVAKAKCNPESHPEYFNYIHFSFVIQLNKIIEYGFNRAGSPIERLGYPDFGKIHSEYDAYRKAKGLLDSQKPFDVVNIRLTKGGEIRISKPCSCCKNFLYMVGCRKIYFSTNVGFSKFIM